MNPSVGSGMYVTVGCNVMLNRYGSTTSPDELFPLLLAELYYYAKCVQVMMNILTLPEFNGIWARDATMLHGFLIGMP